MERKQITRELLASALRHLRTARGLTQRDVARRAAAYEGFGRLLESQISDFERGRALPSLGSLLNLLAACSESGSQVDFTSLQRAIENVELAEDGESPHDPGIGAGGAVTLVDEIVSGLAERLMDRIRGEMRNHTIEMAELRTRVARTERLLAALDTSEP